jgi:hypothetical protein
MGTLIINVAPQIGGYNFSLSPKARTELQSLFPGSVQVRHIYVSYDTNWDFEQMHGRVEGQILPFLTGVDVQALAEKFDRVTFVDPTDREPQYIIQLTTHVQEEQSLSR